MKFSSKIIKVVFKKTNFYYYFLFSSTGECNIKIEKKKMFSFLFSSFCDSYAEFKKFGKSLISINIISLRFRLILEQ